MNRTLLLAYQWLTGLSDTCTGLLLIVAPGLTLTLMGVPAPAGQLVYIAYIGAFVLGVGLCCLYGVRLILRGDTGRQLGTVWLLTAVLRASVAAFVAQQVMTGALSSGWIGVAGFDGACVAIQAAGLWKGWVKYAAR
ncbi:MAG: hypothetical protein ACLGPM_02430 [Acidobacteriota bacterium]